MEKEVFVITLLDKRTNHQSNYEISIFLDDLSDEIIIKLEIEKLEIKCQHNNYFSAFQLFRDALLRKGYGIKCNGSKINAVQSPMMANTSNVYLVELGRHALMKDIVHIWEYADISDFPSTHEQLSFFEQWRGSIQ